MRLLNITNQVPYPLISGAPLRTYNILRRSARDCEVYVAAFSATAEQSEGVTHLLQFCREVVTVPHKSLKHAMHAGKVMRSVLQGQPPELTVGFSEHLALEIQALTERVQFDVVVIEHGSMGMYLKALPLHLHKRTVWLLHDIDFDKFMRIARIERKTVKKIRAWLHARMMKRWQPRFASRFGGCITMSEADRQLLLSANSTLKVFVSPNGVDTNRYRPLAEARDGTEMLFIGNMGYSPNADAARHFCYDVLPLVRRQVANAKVWIVGIGGESLKPLEGSSNRGVVITGAVPDVVPYYERSTICIAPLRAGSGTRLKILEAMALGRPVVSTSIGCEGLDVTDGEHILIADDAKRFSEQVVRLLHDRELRARIVAKAREFVVASYDWDVIAENLVRELAAIASKPRDSELLVQ